MPWYQLNSGGSPTNSNDYTQHSGSGEPSCPGNNKICAVQATDNGSGKPELTEALKDEMIQALQFNTQPEPPNVRLRTNA